MEKGALSKKRKIQTNNENPLVFKRRKEGIKKKAAELAVLCDIPVCLVIQSPNGEFEIWPNNPDKIRALLDKYKQTCNESKAKIRSASPTETSTGKLSLKTGKEITNQERTVLGKYHQKSEESQPKILTQNSNELRMILEKYKKRCNESEAEIFNQNPSVPLCPGEKGLSQIPGDCEYSKHIESITNGSSFLNEGKEPVENWCEQRNAMINNPCFFSEVFDFPPLEVLDPDSEIGVGAGASFHPSTNIEDFSLVGDPNLQVLDPDSETGPDACFSPTIEDYSSMADPNFQVLDSSVMDDSNWQYFACQESSLWSSVLEEVGVPSLAPGALMPESPEPTTGLWEWQEFLF